MTDYLCPRCGRVGVPDEGFTLIDDRYRPGMCPHHQEKQTLIREDLIDKVPLPKGSSALKRVSANRG